MAKIGLYFIFTGMLAASVAFALCASSSPGNHTSTNANSSNITTPRLIFRPSPDDEKSILIRLQVHNTDYKKWAAKLTSFLDDYYTPSKTQYGSPNIVSCSYDYLPPEGRFCDVDIREWGPCDRDHYFNYHRAEPCVFLKMEMINGWKPEYYNDPDDLPEEMPQQLKNHIRKDFTGAERNNIWISCEGENPADVELLGLVQYHPSTQGFPGYFFPYKNVEGYLSPLVAVQFRRPTSAVVISIECKAWAKNIKHNKKDGSGLVNFQLLIE